MCSSRGENGKFLPAVSTKKTDKADALAVAYEWLKTGIPVKAASGGNAIGIGLLRGVTKNSLFNNLPRKNRAFKFYCVKA